MAVTAMAGREGGEGKEKTENSEKETRNMVVKDAGEKNQIERSMRTGE